MKKQMLNEGPSAFFNLINTRLSGILFFDLYSFFWVLSHNFSGFFPAFFSFFLLFFALNSVSAVFRQKICLI
jgi:hypothetical protein